MLIIIILFETPYLTLRLLNLCFESESYHFWLETPFYHNTRLILTLKPRNSSIESESRPYSDSKHGFIPQLVTNECLYWLQELRIQVLSQNPTPILTGNPVSSHRLSESSAYFDSKTQDFMFWVRNPLRFWLQTRFHPTTCLKRGLILTLRPRISSFGSESHPDSDWKRCFILLLVTIEVLFWLQAPWFQAMSQNPPILTASTEDHNVCRNTWLILPPPYSASITT